MTNVSPWTSIATRSSASGVPVARANGATPVARLTRNGPSTRTFVKLVIPKLRVAAPAGELKAAETTKAKRMALRMCGPSYTRIKPGLRAANIPRAGLGHVALRAAGHFDVAGSHNADLGRAARVGADAARSRDRDFRCLGSDPARVDIARPGDVILRRLRFARLSLHAARPGD